MDDYYAILGVPANATDSEIKDRYRFLAHAYHPDKFSSDSHKQDAQEAFKKINEAFETLSNPSLRAEFDRKRASGSASKPKSSAHPPPPKGQSVPPYFHQINGPKLLRGFVRLAVILFLSFWLLFFCLIWNEALKGSERYTLSELSEYYQTVDFPFGCWSSEIAKSDFLSLSPEGRQSVAKAYFEKHIERLAGDEFYDIEALKEWFVKTALLNLEQAPIQVCYPFDDSPSYAVRYRNIPLDKMPRPQLWRVLLVKELTLLAVAAALLMTLIIAGCFFVMRWIVRGFRNADAQAQ